MPDAWPKYPARDQVVEYIESYRVRHGLMPHYGQRVLRLERYGDRWQAVTAECAWQARNVVVATGAARQPVRPTWPGSGTFRGPIVHSSEYDNGLRWKGASVLVVGFGNSACEIAIDLADSGAFPHLAVRSAVNVVPRDVLGIVPVLQVGTLMRHLPLSVADALAGPIVRLGVGDIRKAGLRKLPYGPNTQIARDGRIPVLDIGAMQRIRSGHIAVHGDIDRFTASSVVFKDGSALVVDGVVMATGYRPALDEFLIEWRQVCDDKGTPLVSGVPTALPGLYFCGQFISPAGMLREIGSEARRIASHIAAA
jgi:cation diffusion facilitator CzcD-associated flavoprotein CzcO